MLWLALGYFVFYIPYAALARSLSGGYIPGVGAHAGMVLLPAAAIGQLLVMPIFLSGTGWWRYGSRRAIRGRRVFYPQNAQLAGAFFSAVIIGTTTLNFTFPGVSVLFMLLMMRAGTLILAPVVDRARRRKVHLRSWAAVGFSLLGVAIALGDVDTHALRGGAVVSLAAYLFAYVGRFQIMGRVAKTGVRQVDRRYFVGEHAAAPVFLLGMLALGALAGHPELRMGFTGFLSSPAALPAMGIGVLYECLFIFGTLIYLDPNEYSWAVPINRCASLLSGVVASFGLAAIIPAVNRPGAGQLLAVAIVLGAIATVCSPAIRRLVTGRGVTAVGRARPRMLLFVCGGNTCRSPMAEAIAAEEIAMARAGRILAVSSAGVAVTTVGAPMTGEAIVALGEMGIEVRHRTRALTADMCREADVIYCMTVAQREAVLALAPDASDRTFCLDPDGDIPDPIGQPLGVYREFAGNLRSLVRSRLAEQPEVHAGARRSR